MNEKINVVIDVSKMDKDTMLKMFETEWLDHFQTRKQTWLALQTASILTVALVGIQWKTTDPWVGVVASVLLMIVSLLGLQITYRHRNTVERTKFTTIIELEKHLGFSATGIDIPAHITFLDMFRLKKANTSLFLARMQFMIHLIGWFMLALSLTKLY